MPPWFDEYVANVFIPGWLLKAVPGKGGHFTLIAWNRKRGTRSRKIKTRAVQAYDCVSLDAAINRLAIEAARIDNASR